MTVTSETEFINKIESLPPLPTIAHRIQALTVASNVSAGHVAKALRHDPAIASRILRVANSSFYGSAHKVTQISRAVVLLGTLAIRNVVLGLCTRNSLVPSGKQAADHTALWTHSVAAAVVCDLITRRARFGPPEEAFLAGLLHDAGKLAMAGYDPDFISALLRKRLPEAQSLEQEREHFGLDHGEAGGRILTKWGLPPVFCQVAGGHHAQEIEVQDDSDRFVAVTMIANDVVRVIGYGGDALAGSFHRVQMAAAGLGLSDADLASLFVGINERIEDTIEMFGGTGGEQLNTPEIPAFPRLSWISDVSTSGGNISQALLASRGCEILQSASADQYDDLSGENVFFIDSAPDEPQAAVQTASSIVRRGSRKVAVLEEPRAEMACRRYDAESGVCVIPRVFTVFDLQWLEQQWQK
jgi:HD-like signal output (HDOD) protein